MTNTPPDQDNASLDAQLNDAVDHHRAGRLFEAEEIYRRILAAEPDYPYALCLLGTIAQATGEYDQAVELISRAIAVKPDYTDAHSNLGIVLQTVERNEEALASFDNALALNPNHAEAHSNKGASLKSLGRLEDALDIESNLKSGIVRGGRSEPWRDVLEEIGRITRKRFSL